MPLDLARLQKVKPTSDGGAVARCPACAQADGDSHGQHLKVFPDGAFACAAHPGDRDHRRQIWQLAGDRAPSAPVPARVVFRRQSQEEAWAAAGRLTRDRILARPWSPLEIAKASPSAIPSESRAQAMAIIRLFRPRDVVWIGEEWESGHQRHARHFRRAAEWLEVGVLAGPRICPSSFRPGIISRSRRTVAVRRFLVVECDHLPHGQQGGIFRHLVECGLRLRAVVDTAGRSLHGWFDSPPPGGLTQLKSFLPEVGADPALFNPAQPCRLPGWPRADTLQMPTLIYLDP